MDRYHRPLSVYALRQVGQREAAADVVQEVFLRLCRADQLDVQPHLAQWLYTVCRRLAIDVRRKESRMSTIEINGATEAWSAAPGPVERAERSDSLSRAIDLMSHLPAREQEVLRLKFQHGLGYREIAGVTGLSESNVGYLIHTGLKTLRQKMALAEGVSS